MNSAFAKPEVAADWHQLFPFQSRFLEINGNRMHYVDEGNLDEVSVADSKTGEPTGSSPRPTFLMVHGNPTWSFYWHRLIAAMRPWARAIAVDHVGCGLSDRPKVYGWNLEARVSDLVEFVERLDLRNVTLVGHDWGGAIGMGSLLRLRERFSRIVLLNTATFPPPFFPLRIRILRTPGLGRLAVQGANVFARAAISMATELPKGLPPAVRAGLLAPYHNWSNRRAIYEFVRDIPVRPSEPTWQLLASIEEGLKDLRQKKLLIWGMRDWCFRPACLERLLEHWPEAQAVRLERAGHYVMLDAPDAVIGAIQQFAGGSDRVVNAGRME